MHIIYVFICNTISGYKDLQQNNNNQLIFKRINRLYSLN